jgi:hypothetical protein
MAIEAEINPPEFHRVVLEKYAEGVYVMVFKAGEEWPCRDHLQDNWKIAKLQALEDFGVTEVLWREIPDTGIMG